MINTSKLPKKWLAAMSLIAVGILGVGSAYWFFQQRTTLPKAVEIQPVKNAGIDGVGGAGSEEYNKMIMEENVQRGTAATESGESFMPVPFGMEKEQAQTLTLEPAPVAPLVPLVPAVSVMETQPEQKKMKGQSVSTASPQDQTKQVSAMTAYLASLSHETGIKPAQVSFKLSFQDEAKQDGNDKAKKPVLNADIGSILFARNDLLVTSDTPGTPVMATIIHGPFQGAKAVGTFQSQGQQLVLAFHTLTHNGTVYKFEGYGVDVTEAKAGVASHVNNHTFAKWGGLIAASFLEGLGSAFSSSGTVLFRDNETVTIKDYDSKEQTYIALGKVGDRLANQMERQFDRPPTVTLVAGAELGVLIMNH